MHCLNEESSVGNQPIPCHLQEVLRVLLNTVAREILRPPVDNHGDMYLLAPES